MNCSFSHLFLVFVDLQPYPPFCVSGSGVSRSLVWHISLTHTHTNTKTPSFQCPSPEDIWSMTNGFIKTHTHPVDTFLSSSHHCVNGVRPKSHFFQQMCLCASRPSYDPNTVSKVTHTDTHTHECTRMLSHREGRPLLRNKNIREMDKSYFIIWHFYILFYFYFSHTPTSQRFGISLCLKKWLYCSGRRIISFHSCSIFSPFWQNDIFPGESCGVMNKLTGWKRETTVE